MSRPSLGALALSFLFSTSSVFAGVCEGFVPLDPSQLGKFSAYECSASGAAGDVCAIERSDGSLQLVFPNAPYDRGEYNDATPVREVAQGESTARWQYGSCIDSSGGNIPFYDEARCTRWGTTINDVTYDRSKKTITVNYAYSDTGKKKNNRSAKYEGSCKAYTAFEDTIYSGLFQSIVKSADGDLFDVTQVDTAADKVTLNSLDGKVTVTKSYSEMLSYSRFGWNQMSQTLSASGVIDSKRLSKSTYRCFISSQDGTTLKSNEGTALIRFDAVSRNKNELDLTSSLKVTTLKPFSGRQPIPGGAPESVLYDSNEATFFLVSRAGGVDYSRATAVDAKTAKEKFGVNAETFVMSGVVCFRD